MKKKELKVWKTKVEGVPPCPQCGARDASVSGRSDQDFVTKQCDACGHSVRGR